MPRGRVGARGGIGGGTEDPVDCFGVLGEEEALDPEGPAPAGGGGAAAGGAGGGPHLERMSLTSWYADASQALRRSDRDSRTRLDLSRAFKTAARPEERGPVSVSFSMPSNPGKAETQSMNMATRCRETAATARSASSDSEDAAKHGPNDLSPM